MAIFEPYIYLRDNMPFLATFLLLAIAGLICSHLFGREEIESVFSPFVASTTFILSLISILPWMLMAGNQVIDVTGGIFRTGFGPFVLHIVLSVAGFFIGLVPYFIYGFLYKAKLKRNPVMEKAVALAKEVRANAMICCYDGIYLSHLNFPDRASQTNRSCKSKGEYDNTQEKLTSIRAFCPPSGNHNLIVFSDEGFEDMSHTGMTAFSEAFCELMKGFQAQEIRTAVTYTQPAYSYTTNSAYYTVNGNLCGGPKTTHVKEQTISKTIDFYVVSRFVDPSSKKAHSVPIVSPKKQW